MADTATLPPPPASTPAPAAAAPATAAPSPAPSTSTPPSPTPASTKERDDVFATLDAKLRLPEPAPKPDPKAATAPKPDPTKPTTATPTKEKTVPEFKMPKEFRDNYEATKKERDELKAKLGTLETKVKEWESKGKDTEALLSRQKEYEAQLEAKNAEIRALKQEASPEFKQKYDEPFNRRAEFAKSQIEKLQVITHPADTENNIPAQYRPATWEDFVTLYQMPPNKAVDAAGQMFGEKVGSFVMNHLTKLQEMDYERQAALKSEKEQWKARQAEEDSNRVKQRSEFDSTFKKVTDELAETVEGYKDADPTDKELAELRTEGFQIFDAQPANAQQAIIKGAHVRHRVAAYGPNMLTISRLKAKVAELESKLAEATPPTPGETLHPGGEPTSATTESWEEGMMKAVRAAAPM